MKLRLLTTSHPEKDIPFFESVNLLAVGASASTSNEQQLFVADANIAAYFIEFLPISAMTGAANGATLFFNLWRQGTSAAGAAYAQVCTDGALGAINFAAVGAPFNGQKLTPQRAATQFGNVMGFLATFSMTAQSAADTSATLTAIGNSSRTTAGLAVGTVMVVDPGLATQETITLLTVNTGTGAITLAAPGFANAHAAGAIVAIAGSANWMGTSSAVTGGSSTGATLTAAGASAVGTIISVGSLLTYEPGTANEETVAMSAYNTGTGVFTIANSGTFAKTHASGVLVVVRSPSQVNKILKGDVLTAKWTQGSVGLALPASSVQVNFGIGGTPRN